MGDVIEGGRIQDSFGATPEPEVTEATEPVEEPAGEPEPEAPGVGEASAEAPEAELAQPSTLDPAEVERRVVEKLEAREGRKFNLGEQEYVRQRLAALEARQQAQQAQQPPDAETMDGWSNSQVLAYMQQQIPSHPLVRNLQGRLAATQTELQGIKAERALEGLEKKDYDWRPYSQEMGSLHVQHPDAPPIMLYATAKLLAEEKKAKSVTEPPPQPPPAPPVAAPAPPTRPAPPVSQRPTSNTGAMQSVHDRRLTWDQVMEEMRRETGG